MSSRHAAVCGRRREAWARGATGAERRRRGTRREHGGGAAGRTRLAQRRELRPVGLRGDGGGRRPGGLGARGGSLSRGERGGPAVRAGRYPRRDEHCCSPERLYCPAALSRTTCSCRREQLQRRRRGTRSHLEIQIQHHKACSDPGEERVRPPGGVRAACGDMLLLGRTLRGDAARPGRRASLPRSEVLDGLHARQHRMRVDFRHRPIHRPVPLQKIRFYPASGPGASASGREVSVSVCGAVSGWTEGLLDAGATSESHTGEKWKILLVLSARAWGRSQCRIASVTESCS